MGMRVGGEGAAGRDVSCGGSGGRGQPENRIPGPRVSVDLAGAVGFGKALGLLGWALCSPLPSCRISQPGNGAASHRSPRCDPQVPVPPLPSPRGGRGAALGSGGLWGRSGAVPC